MLIECILRREHGVTVTLPIADGLDATYLFKGQFPDGPQVCEVADERDAGVLLAIPEAYRVYQPPLSPEEAAAAREKAIEDQRLADEARAKQLLDAKKAQEAAEAAEAERIARLERAAQALLENKATVEEARTIAAGGGPAPAEPEVPENPQNLPTETQAAAAAYDAQQVEALKVEAAERAKPMDIGQAKLAYHAKFGKAPHPAMKLETILDKLDE